MRLAGVNGDKKRAEEAPMIKIFCLSRFCELIKYKFNFLFFTLHRRVLFCEGIQIPRFFLIITFSYFPTKHLKVYLKNRFHTDNFKAWNQKLRKYFFNKLVICFKA